MSETRLPDPEEVRKSITPVVSTQNGSTGGVNGLKPLLPSPPKDLTGSGALEAGENNAVKTRQQCYNQLLQIFAGLSLVIGIILLIFQTDTLGSESIIDYTDCTNLNQASVKCKDTLKIKKETCQCYESIIITEPMEGAVTAYYMLDTYDQSASGYFDSRDDKQLSGVLSMTPSANCGAYSYIDTTEGRKPIAPCGEIADAMFNDTFSLQIGNKYVPLIDTGLISEEDKVQYRNPDGNLEEAFRNFSKPKNWVRNVWELNTLNASNNGFQNEAFIAWMKTDWKLKPVWRVNHTDEYEHGIPAGTYTLRVLYAYPPSRYDGRRKFIISSIHSVKNTLRLTFGIILLLIGAIILIYKLIYFVYQNRMLREIR